MDVNKPNLSFEQWREKIIRVFYVIIVLIFLVEVIVFLAFRPFGLLAETTTDLDYIIKYIMVPTLVNLIIVYTCHKINTNRFKEKIKNTAIPVTLSLLAAVIAYVHVQVDSIITALAVPVFLTVLFGKRKMTRRITLLNGALILLISLRAYFYFENKTVFFYLNIVVALTLLITAYLISNVLIAYNKANSDYINSSYEAQLSLTEQARNDSLTGLFNQKTFHALLKTTMEKAWKSRAPMSLAIIDLDDFKEINDTYGHLAGDQVLIHFTNLMKEHCKEGDAYISRYGGDEFAVIFPRASRELAYLRLESLRQRCRQVPPARTGTSSISFSAGIANYSEGEANPTLLFHQADSALYQAKENGKGQTIVYQGE